MTSERLGLMGCHQTFPGGRQGATLGVPRAFAGEQTHTRARELCQQVGETPQLFAALRGLWRFYQTGGRLATARESGEQLLTLAQRQPDATRLLVPYAVLGITLAQMGAFTSARPHLEQEIVLTDPKAQPMLAVYYGVAPGVQCLLHAVVALWCLGSPEQGLQRSQAACTLARERAKAAIVLSTAHTLPQFLAVGRYSLGWALATQGQGEEAVTLMRQGLTDTLVTENRLSPSQILPVLAAVYGTLGQVDAGVSIVTEALELAEQTGVRWYEAETHRIKGTLLLHQAVPDASQAEICFQQALDIARRQEAKSWELRAATSLARLWQSQDKCQEAYDLLASVYNWFTEGFDTADLKEAKTLLNELRDMSRAI